MVPWLICCICGVCAGALQLGAFMHASSFCIVIRQHAYVAALTCKLLRILLCCIPCTVVILLGLLKSLIPMVMFVCLTFGELYGGRLFHSHNPRRCSIEPVQNSIVADASLCQVDWLLF